MNSLVYAYTTTNSPHLLKHNLALEEETLSLYNFDEHSNEMIVLYGSDLGLESIITGNSLLLFNKFNINCQYRCNT